MFPEEGFLGCSKGMESLRRLNNRLNDKVIDQLNESQELVMMNSFARETNEYQIKTCLQERIADIASWQWVFEDLSKRLDEAIAALNHEHKALKVVVNRIETEISEHSREGSRPGALEPMSDAVEIAILEEYNFLREERKKFEQIINQLEKQTKYLVRTKKLIQDDILKKQKAISIENSWPHQDSTSISKSEQKKKRRRFSSLGRWENRCMCLKKIGLQALASAVTTRQQIRGARVQLSIAAQTYGAKVDTALRRRLHTNTAKLEELSWQREEALRDLSSLDEELITAEQNLIETMKQERVVQVQLADRTLRPPGELTRDVVEKKLKDELGRLRQFIKYLRSNIENISSLQNRIKGFMTSIDCCAEDVSEVVRLDQRRISLRLGEYANSSGTQQIEPEQQTQSRNTSDPSQPLTVIKEEDEDDYPFDY